MKTRVSLKILAVVLAVTTVGLALVAWVSIQRASKALFGQEAQALKSVRVARANAVERLLRTGIGRIPVIAKSPAVQKAAASLITAFKELDSQAKTSPEDDQKLSTYYENEYRPRLEKAGGKWPGIEQVMNLSPMGHVLQRIYIAENPNPVGEKDKLDRVTEADDYHVAHGQWHSLFQDYAKWAGYYDIFIFDPEGNLVYTVFKETDFATNFRTGPYQESTLANAFRAANESGRDAEAVVIDFAGYGPSYGNPAAFVAAPIYIGDKKIGVLAAQLSIDEINAIMGERSGMGETGESYLVGPDKLMRSDSRFIEESTLLKRTVDTASVTAALAGESGTQTVDDYRGIPVLSSYQPLSVPGLDWAVLAEKDFAEVRDPIVSLRNQLLIFTLAGLLLTTVILIAVLRRIVIAPIKQLATTADAIDAGDYAVRAKVDSQDEFNELAETLNRMAASIQKDIAERDRTAGQLREANEKATAATEAKSAFLATMSHEIRTPMNSIINMTQLTLDTDLKAKQRQFLKIVSSSAKGLLALINDILDFSKVEAGKMELEEEPFSLRRLFEEITDSFRGRVLEKKLEFIVHVKPDVPDQIVGDTLRLRQILINLVGNAFKFTEKGEVVVRVHVKDNPSNTGNVRLRFSVKDSGIGIPKEKQPTLFDSFSQVDSSTTRKYGGTGLGLAISLKLVGLMGGKLQVESEPGEGTTFFFDVDFESGDDRAILEIPDSVRNIHTLVVDDNESSRELMATLLDQFGIKCELARDGLEALKLIRAANIEQTVERPFDLVLMDWLMPGMDGIETLREIRRQPATANLPVVMIRGFATHEEEERAAMLGSRSFLHKPITASHLFDSIASIFDETYTAQTTMIKRSAKDDEAANIRLLKGVRILMAEDNDANQMVARELLGAAGINLDIAENGRLAIDELDKCDDYALVLMDMQMPEMDGLTATREIRKRWPDRDIPIIALTANAMKGDMERCLEAGMNDYVTKPIDRDQLFAALRKWVPMDAARSAPTIDESNTADGEADGPLEIPGIDIEDALQRLGLPWSSIKKMLLRFADGQPATLKELRDAMDAKDWEAARRHAHSIAGAGGNLSAVELRIRAKALEMAIKDQQGDFEHLYSDVNEELQNVLSAINEMRPKEDTNSTTAEKPVDGPILKAALDDLKARLDEGDMGAIETAMDTIGKLGIPADLKSGLETIRQQIDGYDYFAASDELDKLLTQTN